MKLINGLLQMVLLSMTIAFGASAWYDPEGFGAWLAEIDAARFYCDDCWEHDYTLEP
jgi:hypothetical protein